MYTLEHCSLQKKNKIKTFQRYFITIIKYRLNDLL